MGNEKSGIQVPSFLDPGLCSYVFSQGDSTLHKSHKQRFRAEGLGPSGMGRWWGVILPSGCLVNSFFFTFSGRPSLELQKGLAMLPYPPKTR